MCLHPQPGVTLDAITGDARLSIGYSGLTGDTSGMITCRTLGAVEVLVDGAPARGAGLFVCGPAHAAGDRGGHAVAGATSTSAGGDARRAVPDPLSRPLLFGSHRLTLSHRRECAADIGRDQAGAGVTAGPFSCQKWLSFQAQCCAAAAKPRVEAEST